MFMVLNCSCKVKKCDVCGACSRCGCSHDGKPISVKMQRRRGRQPGAVVHSNTKRAKKAVSYHESNEDEMKSASKPSSGSASDRRRRVVRCTTTHDLRIALSLDGHVSRSHFPSQEERSNVHDLNEIEKKKQMVTLVKLAVNRVCEIVFPANPQQLKECAIDEMIAESDNADRESALDVSTEIARVAVALDRTSLQRRSLVAGLTSGFSNVQLQSLLRTASGDACRMSNDACARARNDWKTLEAGIELQPPFISRAQYKQDDVVEAVRFILSPVNVQLLAWGERKIDLGPRHVVLPKITRKRIPQYMFNNYRDLHQNKPPVGRNSFLSIVQAVTANDMAAASAVDYTTGTLVNDTCDRLHALIDTIVLEDTQRQLRSDLFQSVVILKRHLDEVVTGKECCVNSHSVQYGLSQQMRTTPTVMRMCFTCQRPFEMLHDLRHHIDPEHVSIVDDCQEKFKLYMGHR